MANKHTKLASIPITEETLIFYTMSETKTYVFPEGGNANNSGSLDPNVLLATMMNGGGGFGSGNWIWVIFLFFLYGWNRNGGGLFGGGGCNGSEAGNAERELLMQAIQGNSNAVNSLATNLNTSVGNIQNAINAVQSSIQNVGASVGLTGQQTINAIQSGNMNLAQQLASCCCENRLAICQQTNTLQQSINEARQAVVNGFASTAYETQAQTCAINQNIAGGVQTLKDTANANNNTILAELRSMQNNAKDEKIASLTTELINLKQNETFAAMIAPIQSQLAQIKAAQPATTTVQYPQLTAIPTAMLNAGYGYGYGYGGGFWN